ncbi:cbb3-type cytochrome oxidase assembly protein CcoS [Thioalkalicoccus limnaeus]|uniref:Cbb3-type cytochrome oxidase assembly protein CcoS n=1 Tax=Thioalkalicoccus limnaeus TaxID=120681 RepID=A0ABV4BKL2_9GAMM
MSILYLMIPMGVMIVVGAAWAFLWAVNNGQFDDLDSPAWRILLDDDTRPPPVGGVDPAPTGSEQGREGGAG